MSEVGPKRKTRNTKNREMDGLKEAQLHVSWCGILDFQMEKDRETNKISIK